MVSFTIVYFFLHSFDYIC